MLTGPSEGIVPPSVLPAVSWIEPALERFRAERAAAAAGARDDRQVVPLPLTLLMAGVPPRPLGTRLKCPRATPVTLSLKVTVHETEELFVGVAEARLIEVTVGAVRSIV